MKYFLYTAVSCAVGTFFDFSNKSFLIIVCNFVIIIVCAFLQGCFEKKGSMEQSVDHFIWWASDSFVLFADKVKKDVLKLAHFDSGQVGLVFWNYLNIL